MNRKDILSLMEAYEEVSLDNSGDLNQVTTPSPESAEEISEPKVGLDELQDMAREEQKMVVSHLHAIRSHAHEINSIVENGAVLDPWMEEKIAIANDYIVHVANSLIYRK